MDRQKNVLARLGLHRPELRAWAMYDWANSAFATTIITAIFPVYFTAVASADLAPGEATRLLARTTTIALGISAILAPVLGAIADVAPIKKRLLGIFVVIGSSKPRITPVLSVPSSNEPTNLYPPKVTLGA